MNIEYITLGLYFVMLVSLGFVFSRLNRNVSDFIRGGASATWWLAGSSMVMAGISAFTFTGNASAAFEAGPTFLIIYVANCLAYMICGLFLGAWFRQTRAYTIMDIVRDRFGISAEQFSSYIMLFMNPFAAAIQLWALAIFSSAVFGFQVGPTIIGIGCIIILYSSIGGRWAILATDFAQSLILFSITILIAVLALVHIGGLGAFFSYFSDPRFADDFRLVKEPGQFDSGRFTWKWIFVIFFIQIYQQISMSHAHRFLAIKDGREAKKASWLAMFLMGFGSFIWFVPPMVARFMFEGDILAMDVQNPSEASYAFIAIKLLPEGMMGIMIAAMFAATISSMDTGVNNQVGIVVRNIIPRILSGLRLPAMSDKREMAMCKLVTVALGLLIIQLALMMSGQQEFILFDAYFVIASIIGIPLGLPMLLGMYFRRLPKISFFVIFAISFLPAAYSLYDGRFNGNDWTIQDRSLWVFVFGIIGTIISFLLWPTEKSKARAEIETFFKTMLTPIDFAKEIGAGQDLRQLNIMGMTSILIGSFILLLLFLPNPLTARLEIAAVAAFVLIIGTLLRRGASNRKTKNEKT